MNEWVSVLERLPAPNEYVKRVRKSYLVQNVYDDMMVATYQQDNNGKRFWVQTYAFDPIADEIVAWRELPELYKDGKQDE